jgi:hypothetical protein
VYIDPNPVSAERFHFVQEHALTLVVIAINRRWFEMGESKMLRENILSTLPLPDSSTHAATGVIYTPVALDVLVQAIERAKSATRGLNRNKSPNPV